jgi:Predicted exporters of the RND superfamily
LDQVNIDLDMFKKKQGQLISKYNQTIKNLIKDQNQFATIRLSGIPMIADDMITFIKKDIVIFGFGVFAFIILILWTVFRDFKWVRSPYQLLCFHHNYGWIFRGLGLESYCHIIKFYCINAYTDNFDEYSLSS